MHSPVPPLVQSMTALSKILDKAAAYAEAKKIKPEVMGELRLIADMLPFWRQICIMTDHAKGMSARLAGLEVPAFEDTERTLPELKERIAKTLAFVQSIPDSAFEGAEDRTVSWRTAGREVSAPALKYYQSFALPNFYFHMTTAYDILRSNGVEIGKTDFLGG